MNLVCVASSLPVGATFLEWSLYYLLGQKNYYYASDQQWIPVVDNPVTEKNAHGHKKNHPNGQDKILNLLSHLTQQHTNSLLSFYAAPCSVLDAKQTLKLSSSELLTQQGRQQVTNHRAADFQDALDLCISKCASLIYLHADPGCALYFFRNQRNDDTFWLNDEHNVLLPHDNFFFADSISTWTQLELTEVWDQRERLALDMRPFEMHWFDPKFDQEHVWINCLDWWHDPCTTITDLFHRLGWSIDTNRWHHWCKTAQQWQEIHRHRIWFMHNIEHVLDAIVHNSYFVLPQLSLVEEAIIQHLLIYRHDLNLRTWQLTQFPKNTQQLHALLENNHHCTDRIY